MSCLNFHPQAVIAERGEDCQYSVITMSLRICQTFMERLMSTFIFSINPHPRMRNIICMPQASMLDIVLLLSMVERQ